MSVTLSQLINQVREELLAPRQASTPDAMYPFLFVEEVELEVEVTVGSAMEAGGQVRIHVVEVGGGAEKSNEQTHRIRIKMTPLLSKEEVRDELKQSPRTWKRTQQTGLRGTTKDFPTKRRG